MLTKIIETRGHTTPDGLLNLNIDVGIADAEVAVTVLVRRAGKSGEVDANGWPKGYFEQVAGSMPDLQRAPQGEFEDRS